MTRYWINVKDIKPSSTEIVLEEERKAIRDVKQILKYKFDFDTYLDGFVYNTEDKLEMQEVITNVKKTVHSYLFEYVSDYDSLLSVFTQPQCPSCKRVCWFKDNYCSQCGSKLSSKESIDTSKTSNL